MNAPTVVLASSDDRTRQVLEEAGYALLFAPTADALIDVLGSGYGDIAVVDAGMLSAAARRIADAVKRKRPGIPIVVLGGEGPVRFPMPTRHAPLPGDGDGLMDAIEHAFDGVEAGSKSRQDSLSRAVGAHLARYFEAHAPGLPGPGLHGRVLREVERSLITHALDATRGNQLKAATLLGLNRNTLRKKIRDLDIDIVRGIR